MLVPNKHDQCIPQSSVLVNGRSAEYLCGLNAPIRNGDEVIVMRPSVGAL